MNSRQQEKKQQLENSIADLNSELDIIYQLLEQQQKKSFPRVDLESWENMEADRKGFIKYLLQNFDIPKSQNFHQNHREFLKESEDYKKFLELVSSVSKLLVLDDSNEASIQLFYTMLLNSFFSSFPPTKVQASKKRILLYPEYAVRFRKEKKKGKDQKKETERKQGMRPDLLVGYQRRKDGTTPRSFTERPRVIIEFKRTRIDRFQDQALTYFMSFLKQQLYLDTAQSRFHSCILLSLEQAIIYVTEGQVLNSFKIDWDVKELKNVEGVVGDQKISALYLLFVFIRAIFYHQNARQIIEKYLK